MKLLESYLDYLNEVDFQAVGKAISGEAAKGAISSLKWTAGVTVGLGAAWKAANFAFSKAYRKCGFAKGPGKDMCLARERIKILQQQTTILSKVLAGCGKTKNPEMCKQQTQLKIEKTKNKIESNQNKLKAATEVEESLKLNEVSAVGVAGVAASMVAMSAVDFATKKAWRTALAIFSQASRKCGIYKTGPEREACMSKWKVVSLTKQLAVMNQMINECNKKKNADQCKEKLNEKLEKIKTQIQLHQDNVRIYTKQADVEKREKLMKQAAKEEKKRMKKETNL